MMARRAACLSCQRTVDSSPELAFFEDRGPGSDAAARRCATCSYEHVAGRPYPHAFAPCVDGMALDAWYCGCRGWE